MGREQHNAGIHLVPFGKDRSKDEMASFDKFGAIIAENNLRKKAKEVKVENTDKDKFFENVKMCNFIMLTANKYDNSKCPCGGQFIYKENMKIKYRKNSEVMSEVYVTGKICRDCERKLVLENLLLDRYRNSKKI